MVGGGGCLVAGLFGVNRSFRTFPPNPEIPEGLPENGAKTTPGRQRGNPRTVGSDSIEARENTHLRQKSKRLFGPRHPSGVGPARAGGAI